VEHIISACPILGKEQYSKRRDSVCAQLRSNICKETGVKLENKHWCNHVLKSVGTCHEGKVIILRNQQLRTDRTIANNKPDIIIRDNKKETCMLTDAAIPGDKM
jgi:hypothetical protein